MSLRSKTRGIVTSILFASFILSIFLLSTFYTGSENSDDSQQSSAFRDNDFRSGKRHLLETPEAECEDIRKVNESNMCDYSRANCAVDEGFLNYYEFVYCTFGQRKWISIIILAVWQIFLFIALATMCDDFFCPALVVISKTLHLSPNIAGVTFLAFGNGAPDFFSALTVLSAEDADIPMGISGLFGAGIFVTSIVIGGIAIVKPFKAMARPFIRDSIFLLAATFWVFALLYQEKLGIADVAGLVSLYVVYVLVVIISGSIYKRSAETEDPLAREEICLDCYERRQTVIGNHHFNHDNVAFNDDMMATYIRTTLDTVAEIDNLFEEALKEAAIDVNTNESDQIANGKAKRISKALLVSMELPIGENGQVVYVNPGDSITSEFSPNGSMSEKRKSSSSSNLLQDEELIPLSTQFLNAIIPVDHYEWRHMGILSKFYDIFKSPFMFATKLTCPVVDYDISDTNNWNKALNSLHCIICPTFIVLVLNLFNMKVGGFFPVYGITLIAGAILAVIVWCTSEVYKKPKYHEAFGYLAFIIAIVWIRTVANEIVELLKTFGIYFGVSTAILGLTLLAVGNSVGDFVANVIMARQGFARMGFSACFGAPIFNISLGFGVAMIIKLAKSGATSIPLEFKQIQMVLAGFNILTCASSLVAIPFILKYNVNRAYGVYLTLLYLTFVAVAVLTELQIIDLAPLIYH